MSSSKLLDSLETSVKGLKREKSCLEQKLKDMKGQKKSLRSTVDGMMTKRSQLQEINAKMKETLSVAQHKVSHTQEQQNTIQNLVDDKRKKQSEILRSVDQERQTQLKESAEFEEELSSLANTFLSAQKYYKIENLEHELMSSEEQQKDLMEEQHKYNDSVELLGEELNHLYLENEKTAMAASEMFIPPPEQKELISHFNQWNKSIKEWCDDLTKRHETLMVELKNVNKMLQ